MSDVQSVTFDPGDRFAGILANLLSWAESDPNVRAVIQTGSSTRRTPGAMDRFSDRDIELICHNPKLLANEDGWIHALSPVWVALYLDNGPGNYETRLVFFEGARKVDFTIADKHRIQTMIEPGPLNDLYGRGYQVLLDKDALSKELPEPIGEAPPGRTLPKEAEFAASVDEFWFEAAHMPMYLAREDFWVVKLRDATMKEMLLRMLEWHTLYFRGPSTDVWYRGTKMKRWVDAATWSELHNVFGSFEVTGSYRAIAATMEIFIRLTHKVARLAGFTVPESELHIHSYVLSFAEIFLEEGPNQP